MHKKTKIEELQRHSTSNLSHIRNKNGLIDAKNIFKAKKESDQWWEDALKRINNISKPRKS